MPAGYANNHLMNSPGRTIDQVVAAWNLTHQRRRPEAMTHHVQIPRACIGNEPRGVLHTWFAKDSSLCFSLRRLYFDNGLELSRSKHMATLAMM